MHHKLLPVTAVLPCPVDRRVATSGICPTKHTLVQEHRQYASINDTCMMLRMFSNPLARTRASPGVRQRCSARLSVLHLRNSSPRNSGALRARTWCFVPCTVCAMRTMQYDNDLRSFHPGLSHGLHSDSAYTPMPPRSRVLLIAYSRPTRPCLHGHHPTTHGGHCSVHAPHHVLLPP